MSRSTWDNMQQSFASCMDPNTKQIKTLTYLEVCDRVSNVFEAMFMGLIASQLKADIDNSSSNLKNGFLNHPENCDTIDTLLDFTLKKYGKEELRMDRASPIHGLLWSKRSVQFVVFYLDLLSKRPDLTAPECAQQTYEIVLMPYHGWLTSKFASTVMGFSPVREDIYAKLVRLHESKNHLLA